MIKIVVESPFGRNVDGSKCSPAEYERNRRYLDRALKHSISMGDEAPYASHRFYPGLLDDTSAAERALGMRMGLIWSEAAQMVAVYQDHGVTEGMQKALVQHRERGIKIVFRSIGAEPEIELAPSSAELFARIEKLTGQRNELAEYADPNLLRSMGLTDHNGKEITEAW